MSNKLEAETQKLKRELKKRGWPDRKLTRPRLQELLLMQRPVFMGKTWALSDNEVARVLGAKR